MLRRGAAVAPGAVAFARGQCAQARVARMPYALGALRRAVRACGMIEQSQFDGLVDIVGGHGGGDGVSGGALPMAATADGTGVCRFHRTIRDAVIPNEVRELLSASHHVQAVPSLRSGWQR